MLRDGQKGLPLSSPASVLGRRGFCNTSLLEFLHREATTHSGKWEVKELRGPFTSILSSHPPPQDKNVDAFSKHCSPEAVRRFLADLEALLKGEEQGSRGGERTLVMQALESWKGFPRFLISFPGLVTRILPAMESHKRTWRSGGGRRWACSFLERPGLPLARAFTEK